MEQKNSVERCVVFMNENEWKWNKIGGNNWTWKVEEIPSSQLENDDTMQLVMKKLHEQMLKWIPHGKKISTCAIFCVNDGIDSWF
jgi:hypothetical protein